MKKNKHDPYNTEKWDALLKKFYEGETSLAEEKQLHDFLAGEQAPDASFEADKAVFAYISMNKAAGSLRNIPVKKYWIIRISAAAAILAGAIFCWTYTPADDYVAYVGGKRYTSPEIVRQQMENTLNSLHVTDIPVEQQLSDIFVEPDSNQ